MSTLKKISSSFWEWYERHYTLNVSVSTFLFLLQVVHLYWLTFNVAAQRLTGKAFYTPNGFFEWLILIVDYFEIPALIGVSLIYINDLRQGKKTKTSLLYLFFLNTQWLHIFWITDEFVVDKLVIKDPSTILPAWLAWIAILIDYLELPVMYDTLKRFLTKPKPDKQKTNDSVAQI